MTISTVVQARNGARFFERAAEKHGNRFDYSAVDFTRVTDVVTIGCPVHGEQHMTPEHHIKLSSGCPTCSIEAACGHDDPFEDEETSGGNHVLVCITLDVDYGPIRQKTRPGFDMLLAPTDTMHSLSGTILELFDVESGGRKYFDVEDLDRFPTQDASASTFVVGDTFRFVTGVMPALNGGRQFLCKVLSVDIDPEAVEPIRQNEYPGVLRRHIPAWSRS
ncbi:DUF723 domain-containing protein [Curtobacterium citreum]